jgi:hypothetical protein
MTMMKHAFWLLGVLAGCSSSHAGDPQQPASEPAETFGESTAVPDGYTRYYSTVQEVPPGESLMLVEWVADALDADKDVMDVRGGQTKAGHHASLTASSAIEPVGTVRDQVIDDQFTATLLGAVGGEGQGGGAFEKPDNYAFRVSKGQGLYLQTHYINPTDRTLQVRSYVDVKFAEPSSDHVVLSMFSFGTVKNQAAPASESTVTMDCKTQEDLSFAMFTNHMHEYGKAVRTVAILPDGSESVIKDDPVWQIEWVANSNYTYRFQDPLVIPSGSNLRTQCTYQNTTTHELAFPDEMCAFVAFLPGGSAITCLDGAWIKN